MLSKSVWIGFGIVTLILLFTLIFRYEALPAGDIVEYFGITETVLTHGGLNLTPETKTALETKYLNPGYFEDPGHYLQGIDDQRYPVHFFFYSILAIPARLFLRLLQQNELNTFAVTNLLIFTGTLALILKRYVHSPFKRVVFLFLCYFSPFLTFITWPGPDLLYMCLLLIALFAFFAREYAAAAILATVASWHSQPLIIVAFAATGYFVIKEALQADTTGRYKIHISRSVLIVGGAAFFIVILPYIYNLMAFGVFSPWTILPDGWTKLNGFGLQNASVWKLYEQLFDLNYGLFWYAPLILALGIYALFFSGRQHRMLWYVSSVFLITAFFYQTNPAWHYGTAGYGPSRHAIFLLPLFLYLAMYRVRPGHKYTSWITGVVISQLIILSFNGLLFPDFRNTLKHSALATYALTTYPSIYNPTPEIFVDRTNNDDKKEPDSAIYKHNGYCTKAYILYKDKESLEPSCGYIPEQYKEAFEKLNEFEPYKGIYINY